MAIITVTATTINGATPANSLQALDSERIVRMTGAGNSTSGAATIIVEGREGRSQGATPVMETWVVTETYAAVKAAILAADQEAGAELLTNKATTFGTVNDTLYPSTEAVFENFMPVWYVATPLPQADTYSANLSPAPTAYTDGMMIFLKVATTNTTTSTFNANSLGAKTIKKGTAGSTNLAAGDLVVGKVYTLIYDGTNFQINI